MKRLLGAAIAGVLLTAASVLPAPVAVASPIARTIAYDCDIPIFGPKTLNVEVHADIPATATIGVPVHITNVTVTVPLPSDVYSTFTPFGATQADGAFEFTIVVHLAGQPDIHLPIEGTIPPTPLPSPAGPSLLLVGSGPAPSFTLTVAGTAHVSAGPNLTMHLTPRDSGGGPTILGTLDIPGTASGDTHLGDILVS